MSLQQNEPSLNNQNNYAFFLLASSFGLLLGISLSLVIFYFYYYEGAPSKNYPSPSLHIKEHHLGKNDFINPLLDCTREDEKGNISLESLHLELQKTIEKEVQHKNIHNVSLYYRDLNNGPWFTINKELQFNSGSLLKLPVIVEYFKNIENDPSELQRKYTFYQKDFSNDFSKYYFPPRLHVEDGKSYTVHELAKLALIHSDNFAAMMLLESPIGKEFNLNRKNSSKKDLYSLNLMKSSLNVKTYSSIFRILYNASYLNHGLSNELLKMLAQAEFTQGIVAGVPRGINIAHKFGEYGRGDKLQLHDCGIIYHKITPYLLCIMTKGNDYMKQLKIIRELSSKVYNAIDEVTE